MTTRKKRGGIAIESGGYGCIFKPALKCKSKKKRTNGISKLSFINESNLEMNNLNIIKKNLKKIPNYNKYFLISNITTCVPNKLTNSDKIDFEKCFSLEKNDINATNINDNLNMLKIINMPYGGINLDYVIDKNIIKLTKYNDLLKKLLIKAIIPMNKLNIYHFDLKSSNILYKNNNLKIIDFGELAISNNNEIPNILFNRNIQFNSPFSRILFNDFINTYISKAFIKFNIKSDTSYSKKEAIIYKAYNDYIKINGYSHQIFLSKFLLPIIFDLIPKNLLDKILNYFNNNLDYEYIINNWIVKYCLFVILKYFDYDIMKIEQQRYFKEVYSKNVDIYGFITCYIPIILTKNTYTNNIKVKISNILLKYCFNPYYAVNPIPIKPLMYDLNRLI